jgi:hypothetical protein
MHESKEHYPDTWVVLKVLEEQGPHYRVLVDWEESGAWRLSTKIVRVMDTETQFIFFTEDDTIYCEKDSYGFGEASQIIYLKIQKYTEIMPEKTHWKALPISFHCEHCETLMYRCGICYISVCTGVATAGCRGCDAAYQEFIMRHYGVTIEGSVH